MHTFRSHKVSVFALFGAGCCAVLLNGTVAFAQERASALLPAVLPGSSSSSTVSAASTTTCSPLDLQTTTRLTFRQRTCWYGSALTSRTLPVRAALFSGMAEWRRSDVRTPAWDDFGRRFGVYYARRAAENSGQLIAGYLNHEDPRFHPSLEHSAWKRTRSALLSVVVVRDADGAAARPALAPLAGAFGSGLVGMAAYRMHNTLPDGLRRSGFVYGTYFSTALLREFRPELTGLASRFRRNRN